MFLAVSTIPISIIGGTQGFRTSIYLIVLIFIVTFSASLILAYFLSRPIERLTKNIKKISKGELDVKLGFSEIYEINNLTESLTRVLASLKLAVHKVGVKKAEIFEDAIELKKSYEEKQKNFCNSINGWTWETDSKGVYKCVSDNVSNYLGYNPDELKNHSIFDFMEPKDSNKAKKIFNQVSKNQDAIKDLENININKNGKKINVTTTAYPFFDKNGNLQGYRGVTMDTTRVKDAETKIKHLNEEISDLKSQITDILEKRDKKHDLKKTIRDSDNTIDEKLSEKEFDSVFIFDEKANIIDCNEVMIKKSGFSKNELLSLNMADFDVLDTKEDIVDKIKKAKKNGEAIFKTIHKRKDGSTIFVIEKLQYLKNKDKYKCVVREDHFFE